MKVETTNLKDVLLITPDTFRDHRGSYIESYNIAAYTAAGIPQLFVQDDFSVSRKNVLRGIHGDTKTWKLVSCPFGQIFLVVVDPYTKQWYCKGLGDLRNEQVLIPPYYGNGHLVLSDKAVFHYKQTTYYEEVEQFTIAWNDPEYGIGWPLIEGVEPILSRRDSGL